MHIRSADFSDLPAINRIYNDAVLNSTATFDTEFRTEEQCVEWWHSHGVRYPVFVCMLENEVIAWASLSRWSDRCAYESTVEFSVYVDKSFRGKGAGKKLMEALLEEGKKRKFHTVISRITQDNEVSFHLHKQAGFEKTGVMKEVGFKFGKWLDVEIWQIIF
ncbi:MAG: GNAT family N-acetyltransferase [Bacteroidetes bacterium RIFCSPLOWO2_02_FULL_36_8]|nr:MAG: GNAT family N-acetyltransferase [Bacteroidetes bacterium RIFCSPLOWO2_02_FULL_36_8]OFY71088.1 MAG: GNAT family N-acetyltransferase [Bacteroidetes bacterium RIFCSPLOWO2_12_FULL_37_12]